MKANSNDSSNSINGNDSSNSINGNDSGNSGNGDSGNSGGNNGGDTVGGGVITPPGTVDHGGNGGNDDDVLGKVVHRAVPKAPAAAPQVQAGGIEAGAPASTLPFTGAELGGFLAAAAGMIGSGALLARKRRS